MHHALYHTLLTVLVHPLQVFPEHWHMQKTYDAFSTFRQGAYRSGMQG